MDNNTVSANEYDDEIDLRELFGVLWSGKIKIIVITAIFSVGSVIYALSLPNKFTATTVLAPSQQSSGGLSNALGQMSGLASFASIRLKGGTTTEAERAIQIMESRFFIEEFVRVNNFSAQLSATKGWNSETGELEFDADVYDVQKRNWIANEGPPSDWDLYNEFSDIVRVSEDKSSGLTEISIEFFSPYLAKKWLDLYVSAINKYMQKRQIQKVTRNIKYLEEQITKTSISEMKEALYGIIEEQLKNKMIAEATPDYVFETLSPSMVPALKSGPKRAFICIFSAMLGFTLSAFGVLIRHFISIRR